MKNIPEFPKSKNHLCSYFWATPATATMVMDSKQLKETLLDTDGWITCRGYIWDIQSKSMGAGVYRVSLKKRS